MVHNSDKQIPFAGGRCRECDYDLTGVGEERCPECGLEFGAAFIRRAADGEPIASTPWDTDWRFFATMKRIYLQPRRFANRLAPNPLVFRAVLFALVVAMLGLVISLGTDVPSGGAYYFSGRFRFAIEIVRLLLPVFVILIMFTIQEIFAGVFAVLAPPAKPRARWRTWRAVMHYHAAFSIFTISFFQWVWWQLPSPYRPDFYLPTYYVFIPILIWWIVSLTMFARFLGVTPSRLALVPISLLLFVIGLAIVVFLILADAWSSV